VEFQMLLVRFVEDCKAGVAPLLALGIIPLVVSVGAAVDYGRASAARAAMQSALDATALMLAKESQNSSGGQSGPMGANYFNANFARPEVQNIAVLISSSPGGAGTSLTLSATGSVKTAFMSLIGLSQIISRSPPARMPIPTDWDVYFRSTRMQVARPTARDRPRSISVVAVSLTTTTMQLRS